VGLFFLGGAPYTSRGPHRRLRRVGASRQPGSPGRLVQQTELLPVQTELDPTGASHLLSRPTRPLHLPDARHVTVCVGHGTAPRLSFFLHPGSGGNPPLDSISGLAGNGIEFMSLDRAGPETSRVYPYLASRRESLMA
jgi:hypothetical protein